MRIPKLAILFAAMGALYASTAEAQQRGTAMARRTPQVRSGGYYQPTPPASDSPSDTPAASAEAPAPPPADHGASCCEPAACDTSCCEDSCCGCDDWCDLGDPCKLFESCCLEQRNITIAGWVDQGFTWNPDNPGDRFNGPMTFNDRSNEYMLNQVYLYAEKATNTEDCWYDIGGRVDLLYGEDWRTTPAAGLENNRDGTRHWNQAQRFYGLAMPQAYATVAVHDLTVKLGKWYTPAGYEVVNATGNFFYSHVYTHQYGEPFTHVGALASQKVNDNWTVQGGIHRGWDQWEDVNDEAALLLGATWTSCDGNTTLAYVMTYGDEANQVLGATNEQNRYYQSIVLTRKFNDKWTYVAHSDYGHQEEVGGAGTPDAEWYSITQYLIYKVNDCLSYGARYEWFRDDDGFRVFGLGSGLDPSLGFVGGGYAGNFQDITVGINYKPHANVLIRPEVRWDWYDGLDGTAARPRPFDNGTDSSQFTVGTDVIVTF